MREDLAAPASTVLPGADDTLVVSTGRPLDDRARLLSLVSDFGMIGSIQGTEGAVLRFDDGQVRELTERHTGSVPGSLRSPAPSRARS